MPRKPRRKLSSSPVSSPPAYLKPSSSTAAESPEPYPDCPHPSPDQCRAVRDDLLAFQGFPEEFAKYRRSSPSPPGETVLDGLVSTLLSQNTTDRNSCRAFASLKSAFSTWEQVLAADSERLEDAIRCGGLARTKAARLKSMLRAVLEKKGKICLEYLRGMSVSEVKAELSQFKGIGPKTVACVLMFHLQKDDFPVDTHVFRIAKAIGWVPMKADREKAYLHLNRRIPDDLKFDLNCLLVTHGKVCDRCSKKGGNQHFGGKLGACPLLFSPAAQEKIGGRNVCF